MQTSQSSKLNRLAQHGRARVAALVSAFALVLGPAARGQPAPSAERSAFAPVALNQSLAAEPARQARPGQVPAQVPGNVPAPARSPWMAPLAGLAAGLGLAALAGRLGFGAALAPVLMLLVIGALATALVVRFASRRYRAAPGGAAALSEGWQGIGGPSYAPRPKTLRILEPRTTTLPAFAPPEAGAGRLAAGRRPFGVPDDFDTPAFLAGAKRSFVRLQSAWDRADLEELGQCATDEMFNALTHELRVRAGPSRTEVVALDANLLGIETAAGEHRASVRFSGLLKVNDEDERLDEVWNLSRPVSGAGGWLLSGIQQLN